MTGIQVIQTLEGIVGNAVGAAQVHEPQALNVWLKAMKDNILYMAKMIEDDFVLDIFSDVDETEETIQAAATWLNGFLASSLDTAAQVVQLWDVATPTPGTTATGQHGTLQLPLGSSTTPASGGLVFYPYQYFGTTCLVSSTDHADYATGPGSDTVRVWSVRRDQ